ncbi:MAG: DUF2437 domain-containing protein, partial [Nitrospirae bacterium]
MLLGRFLYRGRIARAVVEEQSVRFLSGPYKGKSTSLTDVKILTPCKPSKIVCVGLNYRDHAEELGMPIPEEPILFLK